MATALSMCTHHGERQGGRKGGEDCNISEITAGSTSTPRVNVLITTVAY